MADTTDLPDYKLKALEGARMDVKKTFEEEKAAIEADIPAKVKKFYGRVGFAAWKSGRKASWLPALVLGPYQIPVGSPRDDWMKMYRNLKRQDRLENMTITVYWYGSPDCPYYNLVPLKDFVSYDTGVKKNYDKISSSGLKRQAKGEPLPKKDQDFLDAMAELEKDRKLEQAQRRGPNEPITEIWELLSHKDLEGLHFSEDEESPDKEEELDTPSPEKPKAKAKSTASKPKAAEGGKAKKGKKRKAESPEEQPPPEKKPKKKSKKGFSTKKETKAAEEKPEQKDQSQVDSMDFAEQDSSSVEAEQIMQEELPSDEDNDEDYGGGGGDGPKKDANIVEEEDEKLTDVVPETTTAKKPKKKKERSTSAKVHNKGEKFKAADWKTKAGLKRILTQNETDFCPMLDRWTKHIKSKNDTELNQIVIDLTAKIDELCPFFIELYNISGMLKASKKILVEKGVGAGEIKACRQMFQAHYTEKRKLVPEKFSLSKRRVVVPKPKSAPPATESSSSKEGSAVVNKNKDGSKDKLATDAAVSKKQDLGAAASRAPTPQPAKGESSSGDLRKPDRAAVKRAVSSQSLDATKKPDRSAFSLGNFLSKPKHASAKKSAAEKASAASPALPKWMTATECSLVIPKDNKDRTLALEFLRQMAERFPKHRKVSVETMALSVEQALYLWACGGTGSDSSWSRSEYWDRVHTLVACVSGRKTAGTLMSLMLNGDFDHPAKLVGLDKKTYTDSFEGLPIFL